MQYSYIPNDGFQQFEKFNKEKLCSVCAYVTHILNTKIFFLALFCIILDLYKS